MSCRCPSGRILFCRFREPWRSLRGRAERIRSCFGRLPSSVTAGPADPVRRYRAAVPLPPAGRAVPPARHWHRRRSSRAGTRVRPLYAWKPRSSIAATLDARACLLSIAGCVKRDARGLTSTCQQDFRREGRAQPRIDARVIDHLMFQ